MKNMLCIAVCCICGFGLMFLGCQSDKKDSGSVVVQNRIPDTTNKVLLISGASHSYLNEADVGKVFVITGKLQGTDGNWSVLENPESKSRVTFRLTVPSELEKNCAALQGTEVTVTGILTEASAMWTKELALKTIKK